MKSARRRWGRLERTSASSKVISVSLAVAATSLIVLACDGSIAAPGSDRIVARGNEVTTVWSIDGGSVTYGGAMTRQVTERQTDSSLVTISGPFRSLKLSTADIDKHRLAIEPKALKLSLRVMQAMYPLAQVSPGDRDTSRTIFRPSFRGVPTEHWRSPEGRDFGFQTLTTKEKGVTASLLYMDGRAVVLAEFGYTKKSGKWKTNTIRSTLFDQRGRPTKVIDTDMTNVGDVTPSVVSLLRESSRKGVNWLSSGLKTLALPDAAYAATTELPGMDCYQEFLLAAAADARAAFWASAALIAGAECPTPLAALTCIAAASALEQYYVALKDYKAKYEALKACREAHGHCMDESRGFSDGLNFGLRLDCNMPGEWGSGGNGGGGGTDCEWFTYEISYDGGYTWEPYGEPFLMCVDGSELEAMT